MSDTRTAGFENGYQLRETKRVDMKERSCDNSITIVCRDYLRNACKREHCKYYHPECDESKGTYIFCHDYQNGGCIRIGCRFVHCTIEEEEYYHKHGELLPHVYEAYKQIMSNYNEDNYAICIDYIKGKCKRETCKFRHITSEDLQEERERRTKNKIHNGQFIRPQKMGCYRCCDDYIYEGVKKRKTENSDMRSYDINDNRTFWLLESENEMLRKRVMELKKKNNELHATNEFLLEQNARLRIGEKATQSLTTVTVPAVTITNTGPLQHQGQVNMPQPQVMNALRTVAASMATVPVSLAAVATTPVSLAAVSMAPVQIPPVVTVAQAPDDPTALSATLTTESQSLIQYPVINGSTLLQSAMHH